MLFLGQRCHKMTKNKVVFETNPKQIFKSLFKKEEDIVFYVEDSPHVYTDGKTGKVVVSSLSTAEIGAIHEYGLNGIPKRSFLEMPIRTKLPEIISKINSQNRIYKSFKDIIQRIADMTYGEIMTAFRTNGFGRWKKCRRKHLLPGDIYCKNYVLGWHI